MVTTKEIHLEVSKPMNYLPIRRKEKMRVTKKVARHILDVAGRFDGDSKITIHITARGNA